MTAEATRPPSFASAQTTIDAVTAVRDLGLEPQFKLVHHSGKTLRSHLQHATKTANGSGRFQAGENVTTAERLHTLALCGRATAEGLGVKRLAPPIWLPLIQAVRAGFPPADGWPFFGFYIAVPDVPSSTRGMPIIRDGRPHARVTRNNTKVGKSENFATRGREDYESTFEGVDVQWRQFELDLVEATLDLGALEGQLHLLLRRLKGVRVVAGTQEWYCGLPSSTARAEVEGFLRDRGIGFATSPG